MPYSFLDLVTDVLKSAPKPLTYQEIWKHGVESGLATKINTTGKTPWQTLGAQLYVDVRDNPSTKYMKVGKRPAAFFLVERKAELSGVIAKKALDAEEKPPAKSPAYKERDLHPVLTYFVYATPAFNRGRAIITKTINHQTSKKSGFSEWTHPDVVGFSIPLEDWQSDVIALNELSDRNALTLFSFEIKRRLSKATYREAFFQAVSNSSWAHQGYLVAAAIDDDDDLLAELERLASSFGIGIIRLDLEDMSESRVLYPARVKTALDWETINKLADQSTDFGAFIQNVTIDFKARRVHRGEYDNVVRDIDGHLAKILGNVTAEP
jgi:uncharacterized protein